MLPRKSDGMTAKTAMLTALLISKVFVVITMQTKRMMASTYFLYFTSKAATMNLSITRAIKRLVNTEELVP